MFCVKEQLSAVHLTEGTHDWYTREMGWQRRLSLN